MSCPNYGIMDLRTVCTVVGYSDFHWDSPAKRCQIIFLKMFVKKVLTKKYQKTPEFYADFKSVEIIGKSVPRNQCCGSESGSTGSMCFWASRIRIH
jgi:hypothetical protein